VFFSGETFVIQKQPPSPGLGQFQPLDPWKSRELVVRSRKLPHLEVAGATYFVTFRCHATFKLPPQACDVVMATIQAQDQKASTWMPLS
jgi:hypothetical protein